MNTALSLGRVSTTLSLLLALGACDAKTLGADCDSDDECTTGLCNGVCVQCKGTDVSACCDPVDTGSKQIGYEGACPFTACHNGFCSECADDSACAEQYPDDATKAHCVPDAPNPTNEITCANCEALWCLECGQNSDCGADEYCNTDTHFCREFTVCDDDVGCTAAEPRCIDHVCHECAVDGDCGSGETCEFLYETIKLCVGAD